MGIQVIYFIWMSCGRLCFLSKCSFLPSCQNCELIIFPCYPLMFAASVVISLVSLLILAICVLSFFFISLPGILSILSIFSKNKFFVSLIFSYYLPVFNFTYVCTYLYFLPNASHTCFVLVCFSFSKSLRRKIRLGI